MAASKTANATVIMFVITAIIVPLLGWSLATIKNSIDQRLEEHAEDLDRLDKRVDKSVMRTEYESDQRKITDRLNSIEDRIYEIYRQR